MKKVILLAFAVALVALPGLAFGQAAVVKMDNHKMCKHSGEDWHKSPSRVMLTVKPTNSLAGGQFCFVNLTAGLEQLAADYGDDLVFEQVVVLDYATYGTNEQVFIDGREAYYLVGASIGKQDFPGLRIVAFDSKLAATDNAKQLGGKLARFSDLPKLADAYLAGLIDAGGNAPADPPACNT